MRKIITGFTCILVCALILCCCEIHEDPAKEAIEKELFFTLLLGDTPITRDVITESPDSCKSRSELAALAASDLLYLHITLKDKNSSALISSKAIVRQTTDGTFQTSYLAVLPGTYLVMDLKLGNSDATKVYFGGINPDSFFSAYVEASYWMTRQEFTIPAEPRYGRFPLTTRLFCAEYIKKAS